VDGVDGEHVERLGADDVRAPSLIASDHLHRYELAARLCEGLRAADVCCGTGYGTKILAGAGADAIGIDASEEAVAEARKLGVRAEVADALEYLERSSLAGEIDAVVMFEGLEHLPDPDRAVAALRGLAAGGVRLAVSIPNSKLLGEEDNPFHETDFDHERAVATLRNLGDDVVVLGQYLAEGSLIRNLKRDSPSLGLAAEPVLEGRAEPELASHYIGLAGFGDAASELSARLLLATAPAHRAYMLELEAANARMWERLRELEGRLERIESNPLYRASAPVRALLRRRSS
jgi:SAM-dependent methyltransferase